MSSLPNPSSYLSTPNERHHRHRRSAAISGDFDAMGLGLMSPNNHNINNSNNNNNSNGHLYSKYNLSVSKTDEQLDKHFQFNNDEDFANSKPTQSFSFPNKPYDGPSFSTPPRYINSPPKRSNYGSSDFCGLSSSLNSPIKLNQKRSLSNLNNNNNNNTNNNSNTNTPKTKFFLTEETTINNDNVPDAVIDLDEVLNANLHIGDGNNSSSNSNNFPDDDFLSSPFLKPSSSPYVFSPSSLPNNTLLRQPIKENTNDDFESDEINDDKTDDVMDYNNSNSTANNMDIVNSDNENDVFTNPPNINGEIYSNSSANSSATSLKDREMIEKINSNSSKDSADYYNLAGQSTGVTNSSATTGSSTNNSTPKRSGAKANRYQSFYDQSYKISNALKVSSSESVNVDKVSSPNTLHSTIKNPNNKDARSLGHSSSLPSLKSAQRHVPKNQLRFGDLRLKYSEMSRLSPPPPIKSELNDKGNSNNNTSNPGSSGSSSPINRTKKTGIKQSTNFSPSPAALSKSQKERVESSKQVSNSPVSLTSDAGSTVLSINGSVQSTDHSSFTFPPESNNKLHTPNLTSKSVDNSPMMPTLNSSGAPSIVVSSETTLSNKNSPTHSTNSTFRADDTDTVNNTPVITQDWFPLSSNSSLTSPKSLVRKSPRRPLTPGESKILKSTHIPAYKSERANKENNATSTPTRSKSRHAKSKSFTLALHDLTPKLSRNSTSDDTASMRLSKKPNKIINWFKKR